VRRKIYPESLKFKLNVAHFTFSFLHVCPENIPEKTSVQA
jgi:hypothetical protein